MDKISQHLLDLANSLDKQGKLLCANAVDAIHTSGGVTKVAQYVGVIGYVLKQNRAMSNCIRKKRVASDAPMQDVVLDCLKEYQDGQAYNDSDWTSKYAEVIKTDPALFDGSHVQFLSAIAEDNQILKHVNDLRELVIMLDDEGTKDELLSQILSHADTLGDLLKKEALSRPFRVAAPQRDWWSRVSRPTEKSWNPFSWSRTNRGRGDDENALLEMEAILRNVMDITTTGQHMRTHIYRLKNQVAGYLAGSNRELPKQDTPGFARRENKGVVKDVLQKIKELDIEDWDKTVLSIHQLQWLLNNHDIRNEYNQKHIDIAMKLSNELTQGVDKIYDNIEEIQSDMNSLRQRESVRGRESAYTSEGSPNVWSQTSPAEEFGVLERVLERIYRNPFDPQAHFYAQKAHARLDDKLRYIERDPDTDMQNWLGETQSYDEPLDDTGQSVGNTTPATPPASGPPDESKLQNASDSIERFVSNTGIDKRDLLALLDEIFLSQPGGAGSPDDRSFVSNLIDRHTMSTDPQATNQSNQGPSGASEPQSVSRPSQPAPSGKRQAPELFNYDLSAPGEGPFINDDELLQREGKTNQKKVHTGSVPKIRVAVKLADLFDKIDPSLADIIDEYIKKETQLDIESLPDQPRFSVVLKEKEDVGAFAANTQ